MVVGGVFGEADARGAGFGVDGVGVLADFVEVVVVGGVHSAREEVEIVAEAIALGQEEKAAGGMAAAQLGQGFVPEGAVVDEVRHVEAEAVDAVGFTGRQVVGEAESGEPVVVDVDHRAAEGWVAVVEFGGVGPVAVVEGGAVVGLDVVVGVGRHPDVVARGVVGRDVEDYFQAQGVGFADDVEELGLGAVFGFDGREVAGGVGGADAFAAEAPDGVGREEVEDGEAEALEARELALEVGEGGLLGGALGRGFGGVARLARGEGTEVDLVDDAAGGPVGGGGCLHGRHDTRGRGRGESEK